MAGKWLELGPPKSIAPSLKEQSARTMLRIVRSQGHPYVELREDGKKFIFYCVLCLAPCFGDTVLFDHLKGNLHKERLSSAMKTLLRPKPWPFSDGLVFFNTSTSTEEDKDSETRNAKRSRLLKVSDREDDLAIVKFGEEVQSDVQPISTDGIPVDDGTLIIPHLKIGDANSDVKVREVGWGKIAARFLEKHNTLDGNGIKRIWCEWLGKENNSQQDGVEVLEHDFAVVIFSYNYELGRSCSWLADVKSLLPSDSPKPESEGGSGQKRKATLSDPEDINDSLSNQYDSSAREPSASENVTTSLALDQCDNQLLSTKVVSSKAVRKELRRHQRLAAEKACNICQQKMLPGKDVAAFLNLKTGILACNSRNDSGAFHVFHTSCLVHWIILCEYEIIKNRLVQPSVRQGGNGKHCNNMGKGKNMKADRVVETVFCPECQGTGLLVDGGGKEYPDFFTMAQIFNFKMEAAVARQKWISSPEELQNCSIGFHFPSKSEEIVEEKVEPIKLLRFYRVDDQSDDMRN